MDRIDLQYAAKTVAKCMANPRTSDWLLIKRVSKYLVGAPTCIQKFRRQKLQDTVVTFSARIGLGEVKIENPRAEVRSHVDIMS